MSAARVSTTAVRLFARYNRRYLKRHFASVRVAGLDRLSAQVIGGRAPLVIYLTHAAWWDPLVGVLLATGPLAGRHHRAVIDSRSLERYALLGRLGFVGLDRRGRAGARSLLDLVDSLASVEAATLWLTPQGRFTDPRVRPTTLASGLAHIATRLPDARFLPLAIEYPMGGERLPTVRARFGEPETLDSLCDGAAALRSSEALSDRFAARLTTIADQLADDVIHERDDGYQTLLQGRHGVAGIYDVGRRLKSRLSGRRFEPRHGGNLPPS